MQIKLGHILEEPDTANKAFASQPKPHITKNKTSSPATKDTSQPDLGE